MQIHIVEKILSHFHLTPYQLYTKYIKIDFRSINISNFPIITLSKIYGIYLPGRVINICKNISLISMYCLYKNAKIILCYRRINIRISISSISHSLHLLINKKENKEYEIKINHDRNFWKYTM